MEFWSLDGADSAMDNLSPTAIAVPLAVAGLCYYYVWSHKRRLPYPPSPKSDPLIGNLRTLPTSNEHVAYRDWGRKLKSDIIMFKIPGQAIIVLNTAQAAADLFEKRSKKYSGRPFIPMVMEPNLVDWSNHIAFLPYGERWRLQRQLMHTSFRKTAVHKYEPTQTKQARMAAIRILENPKEFVAEFTRMSAAQTLECTYGYEVKTPDDHMLKTIETTALHLEQAIMPTNFLVNIFPWLNRFPSWFPGTGWRNVVKDWREEVRQTVEVPYEYTVNQMAKGAVPPSALSEMIANAQALPEKVTPEEKDRMMWTAGSLYTAAVHSTVASLHVFVLAMTIYRAVQVKIQEEIEQVTGGKRLPELSDMDSMPYVRCVILEVLRWQPVTPLGLPHTCEEEDEYNGYIIPKDSLIFGNVWAINRDENVYSDPESFIPERFLDPSTPEPASFGFGRRSCPGTHFAKSSLFINITTMLATFNIRPVRNTEGQEVLPVVEMVQSVMVTNPRPFDCSITPRSETHKQMLLEGNVE